MKSLSKIIEVYMKKERKKEYKPLSFSTTMRNPARIVAFLNCILPFEGQILTNAIIDQVAVDLIRKKLYIPVIVTKIPEWKSILIGDEDFNTETAIMIKELSPQNHKEAGFDKGWPSRFDTWYKLPMEFGFIYYEMDKPIIISTTGHMLIDAINETPANNEKMQRVFLNALMKYQTSNPFRKNANDNVPLPLLLRVIKLLKEDSEENDAGIFRNELSLIICWPNNDAVQLYSVIKELRKQYRFSYGEEVIYEKCLAILGVGEDKKKRFKIEQLTGEAVDEFIRKMRITGVVSLRGNGRFLDFNTFETDNIEYILQNYSTYPTFELKKDYFDYMGAIDSTILTSQKVENATIDDVRSKTLDAWTNNYSIEYIINELYVACGKGESKNAVLKIIDKPTRLEFLTSIALKQNFRSLIVKPNYHVDDEGLPTFTASGGLADIECFDTDNNPLVEVTLMTARAQATNEMPAITRHLLEAIEKYPDKKVFSMLIAPSIHTDTKYMANFSRYQYNVDVLTYTISDFIKDLQTSNRLLDFLSNAI